MQLRLSFSLVTRQQGEGLFITFQLKQIALSSVCLEEEPHQWTQKIFFRLDMLRAEGSDGKDNFLERKVPQL